MSGRLSAAPGFARRTRFLAKVGAPKGDIGDGEPSQPPEIRHESRATNPLSPETGKKADLFAIDVRRAHLVPTLRVVSALIHQGQPADVTDVMVYGAWVMRDSRVLNVDEADVIARAEEAGHRAWRRLVDENPDVPFPIRLPPGALF